jgi:uncharacterized protein (TIGR00369 family)
MIPPHELPPQSLEKDRQSILEFFNSFPFFKLLGMKLVEIEPHRARLSVSWREDLCQPAGLLHGGVIATLIDTAIAQSILLTPTYREAHAGGAQMVTIELRIKYLRPVTSGTVICEAHSPRIGRSITHSTAVVTDSAGKEVAIGDSIYTIVQPDQLKKKPS